MTTDNPLLKPEAAPLRSEGDCWQMVLGDMHDRREQGIAKYGTPLQPWNGRRPLVDLYQELLDAAVYARQEIAEREEIAEDLEAIAEIADSDAVKHRLRIAAKRLRGKPTQPVETPT